MGIVNLPAFGTDPVTVNAANLDGKVDPLANEFNGGIDNDNIDSAAAIANSKLNLASISQSVAMSSKDFSEAKGADVASAATTTIWATDGNFIHITGTTTITSFGTAQQAGDERTIVFDGALTLTHNATSLILPGAANITTAAGDRAIVRAETTTNARVIAYTKADGTAIVSAGGSIPNGGYFVGTRYYYGWPYASTSSSAAVVADRLYARPFLVGKTTTFDRIGVEVTTGAASTNVRLGIYNFVNGLPTSLVLDAGTIDSASTGVKEITISQSLTAGVYAFAYVSNGTPTLRNCVAPGHNDSEYFFGAPDTSSGDTKRLVYYAFTYAALPASYSASVTYDTTNNPHAQWLRVSA